MDAYAIRFTGMDGMREQLNALLLSKLDVHDHDDRYYNVFACLVEILVQHILIEYSAMNFTNRKLAEEELDWSMREWEVVIAHRVKHV